MAANIPDLSNIVSVDMRALQDTLQELSDRLDAVEERQREQQEGESTT